MRKRWKNKVEVKLNAAIKSRITRGSHLANAQTFDLCSIY